MGQPALPLDTAPQAHDRQVERWRRMTLDERVELIVALNADVERLALTGITMDHPEFSEVEVRHELARRRYGSPLADEAFRHLLP